MKKLLLMGFLWVCLIPIASAQQQISGTITDFATGEPLPGVNITEKGTRNSTITNLEGNYKIEISNINGQLLFSLAGFVTEEVTVGESTLIDLELMMDMSSLEEMLAVGYGESRKSDITGSVASIGEKDINTTILTSFEQALQGRAAGVQLSQNSGIPGASSSVSIRGINSITGHNEPLYVIDGVPLEGFSNSSTSNILSILNPGDIASLEVLKDASATAIYGARAANGVILITTKKGTAGDTRVNYDAYYGVQSLSKELNMMNLQEYASYQNERAALIGFGNRADFANPTLLGEGTNWQDEMYSDASIQNHQLSVSGGNEKTTFAVSGNYFKQNGIAIGSGFERYNLRLGLENKAKDWLTVGTNLIAGKTQQETTVTDYNLIYATLSQTPDVAVKNSDGSWGGPIENIFATYSTNPVAEAQMRNNENKTSMLIANAYAGITLFEGLTYRTELGGTYANTNSHVFQPVSQFGFYNDPVSKSEKATGNATYWIVKNYLTYQKNFLSTHDVTLMAGHEAQESASETLFGSRNNYLPGSNDNLSSGDASTALNSSSSSSNALESFFGRVNYSYSHKYLLTATLRADGSSKFGTENKRGYFPSVSAAWRLSDELFMSSFKSVVSDFKVRAGWGLVGGQNISNYAYGSSLSNHPTVWGTGYMANNIANPNLRWESTNSRNIGLDLSLFNSRVEITADAYVKEISDLLIQVPLPGYAGTSGVNPLQAPYANIGALENKGIEFSLNTQNVKSNNFTWNSSLIFSRNKNIVKEMYSENSVIDGSNSAGVVTRTKVGQPIGMLYGYEVEGIFTKEADFYKENGDLVALPQGEAIAPDGVWIGDFKFKDVNDDGVINEEDRTYIGNTAPEFTFGFTNNFAYKNFDLTVFLNGSYGNDIYNLTSINLLNPMSNNTGLLSDVNDYARLTVLDPNKENAASTLNNVNVENSGTTIPRINSNDKDNNNNYRLSSRFVEDGSYLRVKNIVLGYTLPTPMVQKAGIHSLRVYLNVQNMFTFTKYSGYDPEVGATNQNMLLTGIDNGRYPAQRVFSFGVNVSL